MSDNYDVIVIGAGPAGYPAAIRAGQNKLTVACVDEWKNTDGTYAFGGTCLNAGCIPSKALLESTELYHRAKHEFAQHGIKIGDIKLDLAQMQKRRATIVKTMTNGIASLLKAAGAVGIQGHGRLLPGNSVQVTAPDGSQKTLQAKHVVLASGSTPIVNSPQSAILGMHKIQERPVAVDGQVVVRPMMYIALTYDHRIIDGREAVQFLVTVKQCLEDPARMVLGI